MKVEVAQSAARLEPLRDEIEPRNHPARRC
jgi:hypothetical protein